MKQYESYKDSGIEWLGKIPSHWISSKLKHHTSIVLGKMLMSNPPIGQEHLYTYEKYLKSRNIGWLELFLQEGEVEHMWFNDSEKNMYELKANDIVMNEGGDIGKVALWKEQPFKCYIQNSVNKITSKEDIHPSFLQFLLYSIAQTNYFWSVANPVSIAHLTKEKLSETPIIIPPKTEQIVIASYLDYKVGQIDVAISEKERILEDLKIYRTAIISEAVTKGLDKNAEMKDSGIEWIGEIPENWNTIKLSRVYPNIGSGTTPDTNNSQYYSEEGINWLQTGDLNDGDIYETSKHITEFALKEKGLRIYPKGSLVIAMYGATIGKVGLLQIDTTTNQACCVLPPSERMSIIYTKFVLQAAKDVLLKQSVGGGQPNISQSIIRSLSIPMPPLEEQIKIAEKIQNTYQNIEKTLNELLLGIDDLKAYKSSIITEAVTGKVDLREWKL